MRLGVHMRISEGLEAAARTAAEIGCETIQVFAANPNAWNSPPIEPANGALFRKLTTDFGLHPVAVHTPYLLNLASPDWRIYLASAHVLADHVRRAEAIGANFVVTHIGSHKGSGIEQGIKRVASAISKALNQSTGKTALLLENSAGSGDSIGSKFENLRAILDQLSDCAVKLGICLDTAHLWGAGYDVSNKDEIERTFEAFDSIVGMKHLKLLHLNDTKVELGSRVDRHANIGVGKIGEQGFHALLHYQPLANLAGVIEVPAKSIETDIHDLGVLKRLREK
ncbi:MAG: deoxyribonuclease IV [Armatimonadetes bacterium]|nr:deoxyribonuclease IV [Armatimonadota bacterium]